MTTQPTITRRDMVREEKAVLAVFESRPIDDPPTLDEVGQLLGYTQQKVNRITALLIEWGYMRKRVPGKQMKRNVVLCERSPECCPTCGRMVSQ